MRLLVLVALAGLVACGPVPSEQSAPADSADRSPPVPSDDRTNAGRDVEEPEFSPAELETMLDELESEITDDQTHQENQ